MGRSKAFGSLHAEAEGSPELASAHWVAGWKSRQDPRGFGPNAAQFAKRDNCGTAMWLARIESDQSGHDGAHVWLAAAA
jgi:hypothetical protein